MSVSSTFFNAFNRYSTSRVEYMMDHSTIPSRAWAYHPLNWNCDGKNSCFPYAAGAKEFFSQLLGSLESHYGNCKEEMPASRYTWICPSNHDPDDALFLHIHPDMLGFESKSQNLGGKCWTNPEEYRTASFDSKEHRSFECQAWNSLKESDRLLEFEIKAYSSGKYLNVIEYDNKGIRIGDISNVGFWLIDKDKPIDNQMQFAHLVHQSENLQKWQEEGMYGDGLLKAFAAMTKSEPAPSNKSKSEPVVCPKTEPVDCPKIESTVCPPATCQMSEPAGCPSIESVNCPKFEAPACPNPEPIEQSNGFAVGFLGCLIGAVSVASAVVFARRQKQQAVS